MQCESYFVPVFISARGGGGIGGRIFESFFARRGTDVGMDLSADSDERD